MPLLCNDFDRQSLQDGGHWGGGGRDLDKAHPA